MIVGRRLVYKVLIFLISILQTAFSWNIPALEAVGATGMSELDPTASSKLKGILGGEDAADVAGWARRIEESVPWSKDMYFMPQTVDWECKAPSVGLEGVCGKGRCLESSIRHFYRQLTRGEEIAGLNVVNTEGTDFTDADAVRFLISLVGDVSQPLHVGFRSNNFGKDLFVEVPAGFQHRKEKAVVSLFELWDNLLVDTIINNPYNPNFWWSGWTHVRNMHPLTFENEKKRWTEKGIDAVTEWLNDSAQVVCNLVYTDPVGKTNRIEYSRDKANPTRLSSEILVQWQQLVKDRILIAGARLGLLLQSVLSAKDGPTAAKLRRGSALADNAAAAALADLIDVFEDSDSSPGTKKVVGGARSSKPPSTSFMGYNAGLVNIGILVMIVAIIVVYGKFFAGTKFDTGKSIEMAGKSTGGRISTSIPAGNAKQVMHKD